MAISWQAYVDANPDLAGYYRTNVAQTGQSLEDWAREHYLSHGAAENRPFPGATPDELASLTNPTNAANSGVTTGATNQGGGVTQNIQQPGWGTLLGDQTQAPMPNGVSGNYSQVQNSLQGGSFNTVGENSQVSNQKSGQSSDQTQTGTSTTTQSGSSTTNVVDSLGFGKLLQDQATGAAATDAERNAFLTDVMKTGGTGFNSQIDQAVRQSLSGPRMTGSGESSQARAAGYAASDVGRNNLTQRIGAAQQLAGPTAVTNLASAGTPWLGQTNTSSGASTVDSLAKTIGNSTGWQSLVSAGKESQAGTTAAQSSQAGAGNIPQGQPVKTGGCVLCTAAIELGLERNLRVLRKVIAYKLGPGWKSFRLAARGYFAVFGPFADFLLDRPRLARILYPLAKKVVYEELRVSGRSLPFRLDAWLVHWTGDAFCRLVGLLPVSGAVTQSRIIEIARKNDILFQVEG